MKTKNVLSATVFGLMLIASLNEAKAQWINGTNTETLPSGFTVVGSSTTSGALGITTTYGNLVIGPQNSAWCHIETSMPQFYFSSPIYVNGGLLSSYNTYNLTLGTGYGGSYKPRITCLNSSGYVGIGTTNPVGPLQVAGGAGLGGLIVSCQNLDPRNYALSNYSLANSGMLLLGWNYTAGGGESDFISNRSGGGTGGFNFYDYSNTGVLTNLMTIEGNGKVSIGVPTSTMPGNYMLYVAGGILTEQLTVATVGSSNWSDYVFANDYKLKPLSEVAQYISVNKHLPDVPSAQDVQNNGVNVVAMDATLLKKIEELTLYVIDQQKQAKQQEQEISELKAALAEMQNAKK